MMKFRISLARNVSKLGWRSASSHAKVAFVPVGNQKELITPGLSSVVAHRIKNVGISGEVPPSTIYHALCADGAIQRDSTQEATALLFDGLWERLPSYSSDMKDFFVSLSEYKKEWVEVHNDLAAKQAAELAQHQGSLKYKASIYLTTRMNNITYRTPPSVLRYCMDYLEMLDGLRGVTSEQVVAAMRRPEPLLPSIPKGAYLYGSVGTGKSLLMDVVFASCQSKVPLARRVHFNSFMMEVQQRLFAMDCAAPTSQHLAPHSLPPTLSRGKLRKVAVSIFGSELEDSGGGALLCFDEMQVNDPFHAVVIREIFQELFQLGCIIIATSNRSLESINRDRTTSQSFHQLVQEFQKNCEVVEIASELDYRKSTTFQRTLDYIHQQPMSSACAQSDHRPDALAKPGALAEAASSTLTTSSPPIAPPDRLLFSTSCPDDQKQLQSEFLALCVSESPSEASIQVPFGRSLKLSAASTRDGVVQVHFETLCARNLGLPDYHALATEFHTVVLLNVPQLSLAKADQARRFISLIDELYCNHNRLLMSCDVTLDDIFAGDGEADLSLLLESTSFEAEALEGDTKSRHDLTKTASIASSQVRTTVTAEDEVFAHSRALSRLHEMTRPEWWSMCTAAASYHIEAPSQ